MRSKVSKNDRIDQNSSKRPVSSSSGGRMQYNTKSINKEFTPKDQKSGFDDQ